MFWVILLLLLLLSIKNVIFLHISKRPDDCVQLLQYLDHSTLDTCDAIYHQIPSVVLYKQVELLDDRTLIEMVYTKLTHVLMYCMQKCKCLGRSSTLLVWLKQTLPACFAVSDCSAHLDHLPVNNINQGFMTCSIALDTYLRVVWCCKPPLHSKNLSQLVIQFIAKLWTIVREYDSG